MDSSCFLGFLCHPYVQMINLYCRCHFTVLNLIYVDLLGYNSCDFHVKNFIERNVNIEKTCINWSTKVLGEPFLFFVYLDMFHSNFNS